MSRRLPLGELFEDRYRIDGVLGSGGFGTVYAAFDVETGSDVAIKLLTLGRGTLDHAARKRFEREIAIVGELKSEHTVRLLSHGEADGGPYAVFERIRGRDLSELLAQRGSLQPEEVIRIIEQVCGALAEAHDRGLLHRDLKPANILVDERADELTVKLLDFGIARHRDGGHPSITRTGELIGTPRYMSPEQLTDKDLAPSSDIYSLGMVAFELLMGSQSLGTAWSDQLERLRSGHVFSIPELERAGPRLLQVIQRMTARRAAERYEQVGEVLDALANLDGEAVELEPVTRKVLAVESATTRRLERGSWTSVAVVAVLAVTGILIVMLMTRYFDEEPSGPAEVPAALFETPTVSITAHTTKDASQPADVGSVDSGLDFGFVDGGTSGCGQPPPFTGRQEIGNNTYVYIPPTHSGRRPVPLIVLLHQTYESAYDILRISGFEQLADVHGFIVIAPQHRDLFASWKKEDSDLPTIRQIIDTMSRSTCIDPERVYIVSNGHGGRVAMLGSCEPFIAATAIHSFGNATRNHHCFEAEPMPHLLITPRDSPHVPFNGGRSCSLRMFQENSDSDKMSVEELETAWRKRNRCRGDYEVVFKDGASECRRWNCAAPFQSCYVEGGNGWTGSTLRDIADMTPCDGPPPTRVEIAPIIWSFLEDAESR